MSGGHSALAAFERDAATMIRVSLCMLIPPCAPKCGISSLVKQKAKANAFGCSLQGAPQQIGSHL